MAGKVVSDISNEEYYNSKVNSSTLELYNDKEYIRYGFPSLNIEKRITFSDRDESISNISLVMEKIYYKVNDQQWYFINKNTGNRQKSLISDSVEEIHEINDSTFITYQQGMLTGNVTVMDSNEKIKKRFNYSTDYIYCIEDGDNVIVKYNKEDGNEATDIINTYSLTKILSGYEDFNVSDTGYYSAYKNGKLYLVPQNGKNISEIGQGAYCYIYSYIKKLAFRDKNKKWKSYCGEGKKTYNFGKHSYLEFDGNIAYGYEIKNGNDYNYEVMSAIDGTVILKKGEIQSIGKSINKLYPVKVNGKWGIYKFNKWTAADQKKIKAVPPAKTTLQKIKTGKGKATVCFKKVSDADGYLIQYSLKKNFKGAKSKYVTKTKATISKLKTNKKYFFRVKAYRKNGKKKVLAKKWSNVKSVKIK